MGNDWYRTNEHLLNAAMAAGPAGVRLRRRYPRLPREHALRERRGEVNPRGLHDLHRKPRRAGLAHKRLIESWREVLPTRSWCLQVPLAA